MEFLEILLGDGSNMKTTEKLYGIAVRKMRQFRGACGFLMRSQSEFDHYGAGHAGTALSAALGMATARKGET